jgi:hypothetical protein
MPWKLSSFKTVQRCRKESYSFTPSIREDRGTKTIRSLLMALWSEIKCSVINGIKILTLGGDYLILFWIGEKKSTSFNLKTTTCFTSKKRRIFREKLLLGK